MVKKAWETLTRRCQICSRVTLTVGIGLGAILIAGALMAGGAVGLAWTNTENSAFPVTKCGTTCTPNSRTRSTTRTAAACAPLAPTAT